MNFEVLRNSRWEQQVFRSSGNGLCNIEGGWYLKLVRFVFPKVILLEFA